MEYKLAIIGGGPAGVAAGVYASRKPLKSILITEEIGGQSIVSSNIQNWIGTVSISGADLAKSLKGHLNAYADDVLEIHTFDKAQKIEKSYKGFTITTDEGEVFESENILVATGSQYRKLNIPGAKEFDHKGISYCASCDGPMFSGEDVAIIGGGESGFESATQLLGYANSITLLEYENNFKAKEGIVNKLTNNPKMETITNAEVTEIKGDEFVNGLVYKDRNTGEEKEISVKAVFVQIGMTPNTNFVKDLIELDEHGNIKIDCKTQKTSEPGIWAAGDCTDVLYHQNNIAAGDGVKAIEDIYKTINS